MKLTALYLLLVLILVGCYDKKIEITADYIINPNWDEEASSIKINRMKVKKDSLINPFSDLNQVEILNKLEEDPLFRWFANANIKQGETYKTKKVYFNRDNGFTWLDDISRKRTRTFGKFEKERWYKFSHLLTYPYYIYIYVDSINNVHRFDVNLANY